MNIVGKLFTLLTVAAYMSCSAAESGEDSKASEAQSIAHVEAPSPSETSETGVLNPDEHSLAPDNVQEMGKVIDPDLLKGRIDELAKEVRFRWLQELLQEAHGVTLDLSKAEGRAYAEEQALMIPLTDLKEVDSTGRVIISQAGWAIALDQGDSRAFPEGYLLEEDEENGEFVLTPSPHRCDTSRPRHVQARGARRRADYIEESGATMGL